MILHSLCDCYTYCETYHFPLLPPFEVYATSQTTPLSTPSVCLCSQCGPTKQKALTEGILPERALPSSSDGLAFLLTCSGSTIRKAQSYNVQVALIWFSASEPICRNRTLPCALPGRALPASSNGPPSSLTCSSSSMREAQYNVTDWLSYGYQPPNVSAGSARYLYSDCSNI